MSETKSASETLLQRLCQVLGGEYLGEYEVLVKAQTQLETSFAAVDRLKARLTQLERLFGDGILAVVQDIDDQHHVTLDRLNAIKDGIRRAGYNMLGGEAADAVLLAERTLAAVDPPSLRERVDGDLLLLGINLPEDCFSRKGRLKLQYLMVQFRAENQETFDELMGKIAQELKRQGCKNPKVSAVAIFARTQGKFRGDFIYRHASFLGLSRTDAEALLKIFARYYSAISGGRVTVASLRAEMSEAKDKAERAKERLAALAQTQGSRRRKGTLTASLVSPSPATDVGGSGTAGESSPPSA